MTTSSPGDGPCKDKRNSPGEEDEAVCVRGTIHNGIPENNPNLNARGDLAVALSPGRSPLSHSHTFLYERRKVNKRPAGAMPRDARFSPRFSVRSLGEKGESLLLAQSRICSHSTPSLILPRKAEDAHHPQIRLDIAAHCSSANKRHHEGVPLPHARLGAPRLQRRLRDSAGHPPRDYHYRTHARQRGGGCRHAQV